MELNELHFIGTFRDYQQKILDESQSYLGDGKIHIVAAPGSGKTTLGLELICRLGKPALILSPSITIRQQWGERFADAFLPDGEQPDKYISFSLSGPRAITCITYQALYSAMTGKEAEEEEEEEEDAELPEAPASKGRSNENFQMDVASVLKDQHITTICLDEAHHLRTEWHRAVTKLLEELEAPIAVIALTATPPYDSSPAEWQKYIDLCGPIDAEISIPQLVGQRTLCPHQDLVYFSYPTKEEQAEILSLKKKAAQAIRDVMESGIFERAFTHFEQDTRAENEEYIYQHIEEFRSFLYCVKTSGVKLHKAYRSLLSERKKTSVFSSRMAQKGCQFVVDAPSLFGETVSEEMFGFFRERHMTYRRQIHVLADKTIAALLASSMGKLGGIKTIVRKETENLGDGLRMVVLTDYIKKNLVKLIGSEDPLVEMGTVPIFESLRRERIPGAKLGVISGSLTILPESALPALNALARQEGCQISIKPIRETGFYRVEFTGGNKIKVRMVTELFRQGKINVMIGTKSLLGEGWDSPCINSLILASFVGSFMLSNQMRGRAIRTDREHPEKVSNIWHLITPDVEEGVLSSVERVLVGSDIYENSLALGMDYEAVARRFECFMAPSLKEDIIQSGIERLGIPPFMGRTEIEQKNEDMLSLSSDRYRARARWDRSIARCAREEMEICQKNEFRKETMPTRFGFFNLAAYLLLMGGVSILIKAAIATVFRSIGVGGSVVAVLGVVAIYAFLLRGIRFALRLLSPTRWIRAMASAVLSTFQKNGTIRSELARVEVNADPDGLHVTSILRGGTLRDKQLFAQAMRELLSPMDNPRYVILKRLFHLPQYPCSLACPSLLGNNRSNAELFQEELKKQLGDVSVVYVRNEEGHKIYRKCVKSSFINYETNSFGSIVRKEVY